MFEKGPTRKQLKARAARVARKVVHAVRELVVSRAGECCERCGKAVGEAGHAHHRRPRQGKHRTIVYLTAQDIADIKHALSSGEKQAPLAKRYGVSQPTISCIANDRLPAYRTEAQAHRTNTLGGAA